MDVWRKGSAGSSFQAPSLCEASIAIEEQCLPSQVLLSAIQDKRSVFSSFKQGTFSRL